MIENQTKCLSVNTLAKMCLLFPINLPIFILLWLSAIYRNTTQGWWCSSIIDNHSIKWLSRFLDFQTEEVFLRTVPHLRRQNSNDVTRPSDWRHFTTHWLEGCQNLHLVCQTMAGCWETQIMSLSAITTHDDVAEDGSDDYRDWLMHFFASVKMVVYLQHNICISCENTKNPISSLSFWVFLWEKFEWKIRCVI